jgi:hypothetical protein
MAESSDLTSAVAELDDGYLKVLLLLSVRRARSEEPRRAGFWHALAVALAEEQETRRGAAELARNATAPVPEAGPDVEQALEELLLDLTTLKSELRESGGQMEPAGD